MKRIFITGGASGFGRATAQRFARDGWRVCIGDVNDARLETTRAELGATALSLHCDVTREEDLVAAAAWLEDRWGGVDVVMNNAGVAGAGAIDDVTLADWQWILDINVLGVVRGCRAFVPMLKRQGSGHIVNVASMAGLLDVPRMSSYSATKAAVVSISEVLQNELAGSGIGVTVVCPSFFQTNLGESMRTTDEGMRKAMHKLLERGKLSADDYAEHVFRAVARKQFYVVPDVEARVAWLLKRALPRAAYVRLAARMFAIGARQRARA